MNEQLVDGAEMLFRQIHPAFLHNGEPSSDRFIPSEQDLGLLSIDRSTLTTASDSHALYTSSGRKSAAVFGLLVREFNSASICCFSDPTAEALPHPANPAHAVADYTAIDPKTFKTLGKRLKRLAISHGQLHPAVP